MFIDSHCHLDGARFDPDREQVIARARDAGIVNILAVGTGDGPGTLDCAVKISEQHEMVYATVGIHPHEAKLAGDADFAELEQLARRPKVIAWGEIGLDYFYDHSPRDTQKTVFIRQMELARSAKLPIVIHCRPSENTDDAWDDCLALIEQHWKPSGLGGVLHCFTSSWPHAKRSLPWQAQRASLRQRSRTPHRRAAWYSDRRDWFANYTKLLSFLFVARASCRLVNHSAP